MRTVPIPGGTATLRESDDLRAMDADLIEEFAAVCAPTFAKMPDEVMEGKREGETDEEALARLGPLMAAVQFTREEARAMLGLRRASIIACLESWTRPEPVPATVEELGLLPRAVVAALDKEIGGVGAILQPSVDFSPSTDPDSPTPASSD
jgi:hypothetical protein